MATLEVDRLHKSYGDINQNLIQALTALSQKRVTDSEEFDKVLRNINRYKEQKEKKSVDLNEERFLAERKELNIEKEQEKQLNTDLPQMESQLQELLLNMPQPASPARAGPRPASA